MLRKLTKGKPKESDEMLQERVAHDGCNFYCDNWCYYYSIDDSYYNSSQETGGGCQAP
ncbi:MAG: hypothetical protein GF317_15095 [Candidatus Lokiarchaeota archaeon]|nr:hypothetical protein [Candidatus Lokiarchaeota archaeon]